jgi:hypothetical protein
MVKMFEEFSIKWYKKGNFDEVDNTEEDFEDDLPWYERGWAIFKVEHGKKFFLTQMRDGKFNQFTAMSGGKNIKYRDERVLKFNLERAKLLIDNNKPGDYRLVTADGSQLKKGEFDGLWKKA